MESEIFNNSKLFIPKKSLGQNFLIDSNITNKICNIDGDISDSPDIKSLEKFASMVRSKLSKFMEIRRVPKLIFKYDESLERYNNIDALLNSLSD